MGASMQLISLWYLVAKFLRWSGIKTTKAFRLFRELSCIMREENKNPRAGITCVTQRAHGKAPGEPTAQQPLVFRSIKHGDHMEGGRKPMTLRDIFRKPKSPGTQRNQARDWATWRRTESLHRCLGLSCTYPSPAAVGQESCRGGPQAHRVTARPATLSQPRMQAPGLLPTTAAGSAVTSAHGHPSVTREQSEIQTGRKRRSPLVKRAVMTRFIYHICIRTSDIWK